ncbi:MAG: hypothetical protein KGI50_01125 [Patescibacteria group bacterium]|nr:hypothetical protein [Patescibacteria group bacterium]MDE2438046.1 hypothetical protein [Patescibacteria group bacterium]
MKTEDVKLVVFVPLSHADIVRQTLGEAGAGKVGNYDFCSFSSRGIGRYRGNENSHPAIGKSGNYESVEEERIEAVVPRSILDEVIKKVKAVHPYEEVAFDIYPIETL